MEEENDIGNFLKLNTPTSSESESYTCLKFELKRVASTVDLAVRIQVGKRFFFSFYRRSRYSGFRWETKTMPLRSKMTRLKYYLEKTFPRHPNGAIMMIIDVISQGVSMRHNFWR